MMMVRRRGGVARGRAAPHDRLRRKVTTVTALYVHVRAWFDRLEDQVGATAVEYALMLFLIAMVVFAAVQFLGRSTSNAFSSMTFTP
jgi:Flp pilus assembly pilin Flp